MTVEQYVKATTTFMAWKKVDTVQEEMGHILNKLKEDTISPNFDCS
jgi:hypothetical protein